MSQKTRVSMSRVPGQSRMPRLIRRTALIFTLIAFLIVASGLQVFREADRLMRIEPGPLQTVASNIMPPYAQAGFFSLDGQTSLSGWLFPAKGTPRSTIILVHDNQANRLQFGLDTPYLFESLVNLGFNVLAFDLRHSGQSGGTLSAFGYAEWEDVVAAIAYVRKNTATRNVLLYGFGSGSAAVLLALDQLPEAGTDPDKIPERLKKLDFDRSYVRGILLDTPCMTPDSYIQAFYRSDRFTDRLLRSTVPYAVRLSAGYNGSRQLTTILTRQQLPVFLSFSKADTAVGISTIRPLVDERLRLYPDTTLVHQMDQPGSIDGFMKDRTAYLAQLEDYFRRYFD